ncbi:hypothetical protein CLV57_0042 [Mucilaginibacter auburnensis]|uniref:Uncharacterized protein n=1 Tax=Mucilaginibacter auburnensis TaxID=1457233 RepID=A0A2H9VQF6_9SPHI|nr:hypothetical protein CLV57_0042 [Mucilaginibacter auburnensis]
MKRFIRNILGYFYYTLRDINLDTSYYNFLAQKSQCVLLIPNTPLILKRGRSFVF